MRRDKSNWRVLSVDLAHPAAEKIVLVQEGIGDDKIRVNSSSLDHPLTILPDQAIEIVAIEKKVMVGRVVRSAYWRRADWSRRATVRRCNGVSAFETAFLKRRYSCETVFQWGRRIRNV